MDWEKFGNTCMMIATLLTLILLAGFIVVIVLWPNIPAKAGLFLAKVAAILITTVSGVALVGIASHGISLNKKE